MVLPRFGVGQNLYIYKQSLRRASTDWERAIEDWYDEVRLFSYKKVCWYYMVLMLKYYLILANSKAQSPKDKNCLSR